MENAFTRSSPDGLYLSLGKTHNITVCNRFYSTNDRVTSKM